MLLTINVSDLADIERRGGFDRFSPSGYLKPRQAPWWSSWFDRSHLVRALMIDVLHYDWELRSPAASAAAREAAIGTLVECGVRGAELAAGNGFRLLVVIHPCPWEVRNRRTTPELTRVEAGLRARGVPCANVFDEFLAALPAGITTEHYWPKDAHYTHEGYEILGRAIDSQLRKQRVLP